MCEAAPTAVRSVSLCNGANLHPDIVKPTLPRAIAGKGKRGWALLRASLHDPLLVLNIESEVPGGAGATAAQARRFTSCIGRSVLLRRDSIHAAIYSCSRTTLAAEGAPHCVSVEAGTLWSAVLPLVLRKGDICCQTAVHVYMQ